MVRGRPWSVPVSSGRALKVLPVLLRGKPGAYVALHDAISTLLKKGLITENPLKQAVAAISVGVYKGTPVLDLDYIEDSDCDTDMNIVMTESGGFVEIQGTAEGEPFDQAAMTAMLSLAQAGITELLKKQKAALIN